MRRSAYLLTVLFSLLATYGFSQRVGKVYDVKDSSLIPSKRMPQHTEFLNGTYNYPAMPRSQWEVGVKAGLFQISGDVPSQFLSPGFGFHVRKSLGYTLSIRGEYMYGIGRGFDYRSNTNYAKNPAWGANIASPGQRYSAPRAAMGPNNVVSIVSSTTGLPANSFDRVYYNYQTKVSEATVQALLTLNNIQFHKTNTSLNIYGIAGIGAAIYETRVNALNGNNKYNFNALVDPAYSDRRDFIKNLKNNVLDGSFETPAERNNNANENGKTFRPLGTFGIGFAYKLNDKINIAFEDRWSVTRDDLLDGQRWQGHPNGDAAQTRDFDTYNYMSLGLNINLGKNSVQPLYWLNPLDYPYAELRNPRLMNIPKPVLLDTDGDGVTDQFDREQTPAGCPVDTHGVSLDTDGDGVPDCKDKELITPTRCQPVNVDGVGNCKCPDDCKTAIAPVAPPTCEQKVGALPSVAFKAGSNKLSDDAKSVLASAASRVRNNPGCQVVVVGYCAGDKREQQLSWDRVNAIISYMVDKEGISQDRFIFNYGQMGGDCNTVDLRAAAEGETGPNRVDPPHPNLRKN
jgi:outer membrane protein OmpA-like peptidoglycan-associated protein